MRSNLAGAFLFLTSRPQHGHLAIDETNPIGLTRQRSIEFIEENGGGPGLRLRNRQGPKSAAQIVALDDPKAKIDKRPDRNAPTGLYSDIIIRHFGKTNPK